MLRDEVEADHMDCLSSADGKNSELVNLLTEDRDGPGVFDFVMFRIRRLQALYRHGLCSYVHSRP